MTSNYSTAKDIAKAYFKKELEPVELKTSGGSSRAYFRVLNNNKYFVVACSPRVKEVEAFVFFTELLHNYRVPVSKIFYIDPQHRGYIMEDLGDEDFLSLIQKKEANDEKVFSILQNLIKFQSIPLDEIPAYKCLEFERMSLPLILNDLFYFKNYYLDYQDFPYRKEKLISEFLLLAEIFDRSNFPVGLCYRDFQSRNIMWRNDKPYFIDYQSCMKGVITYDLVSFLHQVKANFTEQQIAWYKSFYFKKAKQSFATNEEELEASYQFCLLLRLLQVLGAYSLRGWVQQKEHFLSSIENGEKNLSKLLHNPFLENCPELISIIQRIINKHNYANC